MSVPIILVWCIIICSMKVELVKKKKKLSDHTVCLFVKIMAKQTNKKLNTNNTPKFCALMYLY